MLCKVFMIIFMLFSLAMAQAEEVVHFRNGMWLNDNVFEKGDFYAVDGVLRKHFEGTPSRVIDLKGKFVIPPFADAHNHGFGSSQRLNDEIQSFLSRGIFYVMNPNNVAKFAQDVRSRVNKPDSVDVIWSNGGLTSSGGHPVQIYARIAAHNQREWTPDIVKQAYYIVDSLRDLRRNWPLIIADQPDFIKVYLEHSEEHERRKSDPAFYGKRGIDPGILPDVVKHAHDSKLRVAAHVNTAADFRTAVLAGVDIIAHLPLERITAEDAGLAAENKTSVITTTLSHRPTDHVRDLSQIFRDNITILKSHGVRIALGTDSDRSVLDEAENILALKAMNTQQVLNAATQQTAELIFPDRRIGRLAEDYEANFIVLQGNPLEDFSNIRKIELLVKQGQVVRLKTPIVSMLMEELKKNGVDRAVRLYRDLRSTKAEEYDFSESQLNKLGYSLLQERNLPAAIVIFELNVELFPGSANVYDSLGEALMLHGDKENARKNYQKSLQLNPHNTNAAEMLKKL